MSRIRTVKPDLFASYSLSKVSIEARFLFVGLFTESDDHGILIDSPKRIAGAIFPHDEKVTAAKVDRWLSDLQEVGSIVRYERDGNRYILLPAWKIHQRISNPSRAILPRPYGDPHETLVLEGKGMEWNGKNPLTPQVGDSDPQQPKRRNPRAEGTNPRAVAAREAEAARPQAEEAAAYAYGCSRRQQGIHDDPQDAHDEFVSRYPDRPDLWAAADEGYTETGNVA